MSKAMTAGEPGRGAAAGQPPAPDYEVDRLAPAAWDRLAAGHDDVTFDQTACFTAAHWASHGIRNLVVRRGGQPIGGAQTIIMRLPGIAQGLAYVRSGPLWRRAGERADPDRYRAIVSALVEEYCGRQGHYLSVVPRPNPDFYQIECDLLGELGFVANRQPSDPDRYFVNTGLPVEEMRRSLDQKWRYNLKKSAKNELEVRFCDDADGIRQFNALHDEMVLRKRFFDSDPVDLLPRLQSELPEPLRPRIVLAFHQGRAVAGATVAVHGDTALYQFGASSRQALSLKAGYALQWWIAEWLSASGVRWYDLGGRAGNAGLEQFKRGFVGKAGAITTMHGEFNRWFGSRERLVASTIFAVREVRRRMRSGLYR